MKGRMLYFFILATSSSCHYSDRTETPWSVHENDSSIGLASGTKTSKITPTHSRYNVCLAEHAGNPHAGYLCQCLDMGISPLYGFWQNGVFYTFCSLSIKRQAESSK